MEKCRVGSGLSALIVNCLEADLNLSLQLIVRKEQGLRVIHVWRSLVYITREKSVILSGC